jgi:type II secretory pathway component GspD/PulD (secretin)
MNWAVGPLSTFLKLIESKSVSRVLSNPKIVSRSGQQANFHSGGTFWLNPGTKSGEGGAVVSETIQIDYGIKLAVLPKIDPLGQIDTAITTSIIDIGAKIADNESITKSEVTTSVTVKDGQSILLSGLVRKTNKKKVDRVPLLADIPLVGEIFKSRQATDEDTELLVLVTMSRVQPSNERIKAADKLWDQSGSDVSFSVFD